MWINTLAEFENSQDRERRLKLGFYSTDGGGLAAKVFLRQRVRIPTKLIHFNSCERLENVLLNIKSDEELRDFPIELKKARNSEALRFGEIESSDGITIFPGIDNYHVVSVTMPNDPTLVPHLRADFQTGNYMKLLRFGGFYPERKATLVPEMEEAFSLLSGMQFQDRTKLDVGIPERVNELLRKVNVRNEFKVNSRGEYEATLSSIDGINFDGFLTFDELMQMPRLYWDIEKPMYKKEEEKILLRQREQLLKLKRQYEKKPKSKVIGQDVQELGFIEGQISELERKLMFSIPGLGEIPLFDKRFDSQVSWIISIWQNSLNEKEKEIMELYVMDPNNEFPYEEYRGARVIKARTERELLMSHFLPNMRKRMPLIGIAHNGVYDWTQTRMAINDEGDIFDPMFEGVQPGRDYVRKFVQRMRENGIFAFDTLFMHRISSPYLGQRSFGTSFKLESVAQHAGVKFKKSETHEGLRIREANRLANLDGAVRLRNAEKMAGYTVSDGPVLVELTDKKHIELMCKFKEEFPFLTFTKLGFHTLCMQELHEHRAFKKTGNVLFYGYDGKERENELQIFKKRFPSLHRQMLAHSGIETCKGNFQNVAEYYFPLEEFVSGLLFRTEPGLERVFDSVKGDDRQRFIFTQYLKAFARDVFADYFFARKEQKEFETAVSRVYPNVGEYREDLQLTGQSMDRETLNSFYATFNGLKSAYRSIYVPLPGEARRIIRPDKNTAKELSLSEFVKDEEDLYLLRARADEVIGILKKNEKDERNVVSFLSTFDKFDAIWKSLESSLAELGDEKARAIPYIAIRERRANRFKGAFYGRNGYNYLQLRDGISSAYNKLRENLTQANTKLVGTKGFYLFVHPNTPVSGLYKVRELERYPVSDDKKEDGDESES